MNIFPVITTFLFCVCSVQAQEKVLSVKRTDGTCSQTRVADVNQIRFLHGINSQRQQQEEEDAMRPSSTMILSANNGADIRTDVDLVKEICVADTTFNFCKNGYRILEARDICWPDNRLIPHFLSPSVVRTLDMPAAKLSDEERIMFCAYQGIINRNRPRILLYNHNEEPQSTWPSAHSLNTSAISSSTPYALIKLYKDEIRGIVLYSTERSEHYANLATTIAGLERLLPVTASVREKLVANGMDFPIIEDLTSLTMSSTTDIYNYLYNNYWPRCNHRILISLRPTIPYVHDLGVACGSACVWLDPRTSSERMLLDKMLKDMTPGRDFVLGWYPEERSGVGEATKYGLSTVPADFFENATVYSAVNKPIKIAPVPKRGKLENKIYAAVYISDGDNIQYCQHAMAKIFGQSGRGKMAMNWTISPALAEFSPMMLNYYYKKATTNDCFVSGPSGMGYAMPYDAHNYKYYASSTSSTLIKPYTQLTQRYLEKAGLRIITIWDDISATQRKVYADNCPYLYGLTINDWERQVGRLSAKVQSNWLPITPQYPCYANSTDVIAEFFNRDIKKFSGSEPMFLSGQVSVWDVGPDKLIALNEKLDALSPGNVKIVRADHWFSYYNEAHHLPFNLAMMEEMEITSSPTKTSTRYAANGSPSEGYQWISKTANEECWIQLDFKDAYQISRYVVRHAETAGQMPELNTRDFTIETSLDGITWTTIGAYKDNIAPVSEASFSPTSARYLRLTIHNGGSDGYARIGDIEVYGKK